MKTLLLLLTLAMSLFCLNVLTNGMHPICLRESARADLSNMPVWLAVLLILVTICLLISPFFTQRPK